MIPLPEPYTLTDPSQTRLVDSTILERPIERVIGRVDRIAVYPHRHRTLRHFLAVKRRQIVRRRKHSIHTWQVRNQMAQQRYNASMTLSLTVTPELAQLILSKKIIAFQYWV